MTAPVWHDTPLIPWDQEKSFIESVTTDESHELELGVDELLVRAAGCDTAAAATPAPNASAAGTDRRRQRFIHQGEVYRRLAAAHHA